MPIMNTTISGSGGGSGRVIEYDVTSGELQKKASNTLMDMTGVTKIGAYALYYAYYNNTGITGTINMSGVTSIAAHSLDYAFAYTQNATSADLSGLTTIEDPEATYPFCHSAFCYSSITSANLSNLTKIGSYGVCERMFEHSNLTTINLSSLEEINGTLSAYRFLCYTKVVNLSLPKLKTISGGSSTTNGAANRLCGECYWLETLDLSALETIGQYSAYAIAAVFDGVGQSSSPLHSVDLSSLSSVGRQGLTYAFANCTALTVLKFPSITPTSFGNRTDPLTGMCLDIPDITLHFPSNTQSVVSGLSGYSTTAPFGATAGTVLFDLPATVVLTGADTNTYERNPKYDTASALGWYDTVNGSRATPVYTSGTTDPAVSDTIYSDAACTTPVTTISSIA